MQLAFSFMWASGGWIQQLHHLRKVLRSNDTATGSSVHNCIALCVEGLLTSLTGTAWDFQADLIKFDPSGSGSGCSGWCSAWQTAWILCTDFDRHAKNGLYWDRLNGGSW